MEEAVFQGPLQPAPWMTIKATIVFETYSQLDTLLLPPSRELLLGYAMLLSCLVKGLIMAIVVISFDFGAFSEAATRSRDPNRRWKERKSPRSVSDSHAVGFDLRELHKENGKRKSDRIVIMQMKIAPCLHGRPPLHFSD